MWIFYLSLVLFIGLTGFYFVFPIHKKRPILIKETGVIAYLVVSAVALLQFVGVWAFIILVPILASYVSKLWFVYGVSGAMLTDALVKAALVTRTSIQKLANGHRIDNSIEVKQYHLTKIMIFISCKATRVSKKAKLTMVVFNKFMLNYFTS